MLSPTRRLLPALALCSAAVAGYLFKHVVEKRDAGRNVCLPGSVERYLNRDIRLFRFAAANCLTLRTKDLAYLFPCIYCNGLDAVIGVEYEIRVANVDRL